VETKLIWPSDSEISKSSLLYKLPLAFLGIGIGALVYWSLLAQGNHGRAMFAYLFAFSVILSLGLGSLSFVLIQHLTRAGWSVVVRRLPEAVISLMPLFIIFFIPIALFGDEIFPWLHEEHLDVVLKKKIGYLNEPFFLMRSFGYLLVWAVMGVWFYRLSVMQDNFKKYELTKYLQAASAPCVIIFGLSLTFASFDWFMSLQPHWYSTIYGVYFFAGCHLFAIAFLTLMVLILQTFGVLKTSVTKEHYHDLGKLIFGFTIFWAYIAFSQFMLYWYGNIPEEIEFYSHRLHNGWESLSWALPVIHFFIPFFGLMSRALKRVKLALSLNCIWIMVVHLADLYWLILPGYNDPSVEHGPPHLYVDLLDVLATAGLFFVFFGAFLFILCRQKVLAVGDPRLKESLAFEIF